MVRIGNGSALVEFTCVLHSSREHLMIGVALIMQRTLLDFMASLQGISNRVLLAHFIHRHGHITEVVAYVPTDSSRIRTGVSSQRTLVCRLICAAIKGEVSATNEGEVWAPQRPKKPVELRLSVLTIKFT